MKLEKVVHQLSLAILCGLFFQTNARAAGTVSVCDEPNLRAAVEGGGLVTCDCDGTITLSSTLAITNATTIDASGHSVTISGGGIVGLFNVQPGVSFTLQNLTLADGRALGVAGTGSTQGGPGQGGAIYNDGGTVLAVNCSFLRNTALGGTNGHVLFMPRPGPGEGGAIFSSAGQITLTNCAFMGNRAVGGHYLLGGPDTVQGGSSAGGALFLTNSQGVLQNCVVNSNQSIGGIGVRLFTFGLSGPASGGAIEAFGGTLQIVGSSVSYNSVSLENGNSLGPNTRAGGIARTGGSLDVTDSIFQGNSVNGGFTLQPPAPFGLPGAFAFGGGVYLQATVAHFTNSTFMLNTLKGGAQVYGNSPGTAAGGAVYNNDSDSTFVNCTIANNTAEAGRNASNTSFQGGAFGGGVYNVGKTERLASVTVAANLTIPTLTTNANKLVGGANLFTTNGVTTLLNTIVAYGSGSSNSFGTLTDLGYNLSSDSSCNFIAGGSLNNTDPVISPPGDFGGPTPTMALLSGSPAINAANPANFPPTDQRGRTRPFGPAPDIGAFESSSPYSILGTITGAATQQPLIVTAGSTNGPLVNGNYAIHGLSAGNYSVTPSSSNYLFVPLTQATTVGPDKAGINFKSYQWNAFTADGITNGQMHFIYAVSNSLFGTATTMRVFASPNLLQWSPFSTNAVGPDYYTEFFIPIGSEPAQFFRAIAP